MGYDINRFEKGTVDEDLLICPICMDIFDNPVEIPDCQHVFCLRCIQRWLQGKQECPMDRKPLKSSSCPLRSPNRSVRALLERARIRCLYWDGGCNEVMAINQVDKHQRYCKHKKFSQSAKDEPDSGSTPTYRAPPPEPPRGGGGQNIHEEDNTLIGVLLAVVLVLVVVFTAFRNR